MPVRKERNRVLRELAARKNREFRQRMVGRALSVVTLEEGALSDNYLKVELTRPLPPNTLCNVRIGGLTGAGLHEARTLNVLPDHTG